MPGSHLLVSTSVTSCGEALGSRAAIGRPAPSAIAMTLVPFPRVVFPTAKPPFSPR
jgi:hypothetical protein